MQFKAMTRHKLRRYLSFDRHLTHLNRLTSQDIQKIFHFNQPLSKHFHQYIHDQHQRAIHLKMYNEYSPLTIFDNHFPKELKLIPDPPILLYWKGNLELLNSKKLAVIGSRKPSKFAKLKIETLLKPIIENNITIVSGLAYGIDAMSHRFALGQGGHTIAILGFGYHHIYPLENLSLYEEVKQKGLIISEYHPDTPPKKWHFPERNRLISGLSNAILIIEAKEKSGTMITVDQALEQGKDVYAVPDSIFLNEAKGCLKLIREGALPITSGEELLETFMNYCE